MAAEPAPPSATAGLTRERLVTAALQLVQDEGLDALTMRALGDRLHVKAASLYWHVRNRAELLELLALAVLNTVSPARAGGDWRSEALGVCTALGRVTAARRDAARLLLEVPAALPRSQTHAALTAVLTTAGLSAAEAAETAMMMLAAVLVGSRRDPAPARTDGRTLVLAVDSGSRGLSVRAGSTLVDVIHGGGDRTSPAAVIRGDRVIVRRLRGGRQSDVQLNPGHAWQFHVQAPTWNTRLDLGGLDVRGIHIDSGAMRVECLLPPPRGVVPIDVSSGVVGVWLRRPPGVAVVADVSTGNVQLRLDGTSVGATASPTHWESRAGASAEGNYYHLTVHSGTVRVVLQEDATIKADAPSTAPPQAPAGVEVALNLVLDGVAARSAKS